MERQGFADIVCKQLNITCSEPDLTEWKRIVDKEKNLKHNITIALVGKYVELRDAYLSVAESLKHAGIANDSEVEIKWIRSKDVTAQSAARYLKDADGILVPGGFGDRCVEGKIEAIRYARENKIPFLGICLGCSWPLWNLPKCSRHEGSRQLGIPARYPYPVIDLMPDQKVVDEKAAPCVWAFIRANYSRHKGGSSLSEGFDLRKTP